MSETPYKAINVLTGDTVGEYATYHMAFVAHENEPIEVIYRPGRKRKARK